METDRTIVQSNSAEAAAGAVAAAYRPSSFDSSIFFLQSSAGSAKWPITPAVVAAFRMSMAEAAPAAEIGGVARSGGQDGTHGSAIAAYERKVKPLSTGAFPYNP